MNLQIKTVFEEEIDALADMRVQFVLDQHPDYGPRAGEIRTSIRAYMAEQFRQRRYVGYLAACDGRWVASACLLLCELPPLETARVRGIGHVLNFFTVPEQRRRGVGGRLLAHVIDDAEKRGLVRLVLNATRQGEPLYRAAGFHAQDEVYLIRELQQGNPRPVSAAR